MNKKVIVSIELLIVLLSILILISKSMDKKEVELEIENTTMNSIPEETSSTTTTTSKKTTQKTTKKNIQTRRVYNNSKVVSASKQEYINYAKQVGKYDNTQMSCLINLWNRESGWNPNSVNKSSGACGIPQSNPCSKIKKQQGSNDWKAQIRWGINYINYRYHNSPCEAYEKFLKRNPHWY